MEVGFRTPGFAMRSEHQDLQWGLEAQQLVVVRAALVLVPRRGQVNRCWEEWYLVNSGPRR
jgi:hypothetical protein